MVTDVLDLLIPHLIESDFVLKKEYEIVAAANSSFGKWPQTYGNAFFTDSKYLSVDLNDMLFNNIDIALARNGLDFKDLTSELQIMLQNTLEQPQFSINQFAFQIIGHVEDRIYSYIYDKDSFDRKMGGVLRKFTHDANLTI